MVLGAVKNALGLGEPTLPDGPTRLPDYFPVEPRGCEKHAQKLFSCLANEATAAKYAVLATPRRKGTDQRRAVLHAFSY